MDARLEADCHEIGQLPGCSLLLHRNAILPWWIVVPDSAERELCRVPAPDRRRIDDAVDAVAEFVLGLPGVEKLNVAAIGNVVPQLHIHVIGRHPGDACWPNPVWGHLEQKRAYPDDELARLSAAIDTAIPALTLEPSRGERL